MGAQGICSRFCGEGQARSATLAFEEMVYAPMVTLALLVVSAAVAQGEEECSVAGECGGEENSLLALRRIPPRGVASPRCSARMMTGPSSNALVETFVAAVPVWASMMSAARTSRGTAFHVRGAVVDAAETHALRQAASAASLRT